MTLLCLPKKCFIRSSAQPLLFRENRSAYSELRWILTPCLCLSAPPRQWLCTALRAAEPTCLLRQKIASVVTENTYTGRQPVWKLFCFWMMGSWVSSCFYYSSNLQGRPDSGLQQRAALRRREHILSPACINDKCSGGQRGPQARLSFGAPETRPARVKKMKQLHLLVFSHRVAKSPRILACGQSRAPPQPQRWMPENLRGFTTQNQPSQGRAVSFVRCICSWHLENGNLDTAWLFSKSTAGEAHLEYISLLHGSV